MYQPINKNSDFNTYTVLIHVFHKMHNDMMALISVFFSHELFYTSLFKFLLGAKSMLQSKRLGSFVLI